MENTTVKSPAEQTAINRILSAALDMEPEERAQAVRYLEMYATGRITIDREARERQVIYNMETGHITICVTDPGDTAGILAGFDRIARKCWLD